MKTSKVIGLLGVIITLISFSLLQNPKKVNAQGGTKRYLGTTCSLGGQSWRCNDCTTGNTICGDNECIDCQPPKQ